MNFFQWIYEMWFYDFFSGDVLPSSYMIHEVALLFTYVSYLFVILLTYKFVKWIFSMFGFRWTRKVKH